MRIGVFVSGIGVPVGFEKSVSGHSQIAFRSASLLKSAGHDVEMIATLQQADLSLPDCMPSDVPLNLIVDGRDRGVAGGEFRFRGGYKPLAIYRQLADIRRLAKSLKLDVLHMFGFERTAGMAGLLNMTGLSCPTVTTVYRRPTSRFWTTLARKAGPLITCTDYVRQGWAARGIPTVQVKHGVVRDLLEEADGVSAGPRHRVLFWRILTAEAGGDLCLGAFEKVAPKFPDITFDLALRPSPYEVEGAETLAERIPNVRLHRFPYKAGPSVSQLVQESLCAVFPFRDLSIEPQLSIGETLAAGTACIGSRCFSTPELIQPGRTGALIDTKRPNALAEQLTTLLRDPKSLERMCLTAKEVFRANWNWESYTDELTQVYDEVTQGTSQKLCA